MTTAQQTISLNQDEVKSALRLAGLPPGPASPFFALQPPATLPPAVAASLQSKQVVDGTGAVSAVWRRALTTLTMPSHRAGIHLGSPDRWFSTVYYGSPSGITGFAEDRGEYQITLGCTHESIQAPLADWLQWRAVPDLPGSTHDLRLEELTAVAAIVDACREETLRALLDRRTPDVSRYSRDQLLHEINSGNVPDARWLCGLLKQRGPEAAAPAAAHLDAGVHMLAQRGWIVVEAAAVAIQETLRAIALSMANLNPHIAIECRAGTDTAATLILTTGLQSYWAVEVSGPPSAPTARLTELGGAGAGQRVASYLSWLPVAAPVQAAPASWGAPMPPAAASWNPPANPVPAPAPVAAPAPRRTHCGKCGKALLPGRTFCTGCGAPIV